MVGAAIPRGTGPDPEAGVGREQLRDLLERTLRAVEADERRGPLLRATGVRLRLEVTDLALVVDVAPGEEPERSLRWAFDGDAGWQPEVHLRMDAATANAYLQGRETLAIAIARGRVSCRCDSRAALRFLPAARLIAEPYRRIAAERYPRLALADRARGVRG